MILPSNISKKYYILLYKYNYIYYNMLCILYIDPVARFHLRNGASLYRLNWMANPSLNGLKTSFGNIYIYTYTIIIIHYRFHLMIYIINHSFSHFKSLDYV